MLPAPEESAVAIERESPRQEEAPRAVSILGADITLLGDNITIISQGRLVLGTRIRGDVHAKEVLLGPEASLDGEIWAERIDVEGEFRGSMIAVKLALHASARTSGSLIYQRLSVAEGAEIEARAYLIRDTSDLMPILDVEALALGRCAKDASAQDEMNAA